MSHTEFLFMDWRDSKVGRVLAVYAVNLGLNLTPQKMPPSSARVILEQRITQKITRYDPISRKGKRLDKCLRAFIGTYLGTLGTYFRYLPSSRLRKVCLSLAHKEFVNFSSNELMSRLTYMSIRVIFFKCRDFY